MWPDCWGSLVWTATSWRTSTGTAQRTFWQAVTQCASVTAPLKTRKALKVAQVAEDVIGKILPSIWDIYCRRKLHKTLSITLDHNHPAVGLFHLLPFGRWYRNSSARSKRLWYSYTPHGTYWSRQDMPQKSIFVDFYLPLVLYPSISLILQCIIPYYFFFLHLYSFARYYYCMLRVPINYS